MKEDDKIEKLISEKDDDNTDEDNTIKTDSEKK